jgi:hypothetical protein
MYKFPKQVVDIIEKCAKQSEGMMQVLFGDSEPVTARSLVLHDRFMEGFARGTAKSFEARINKGLSRETIESFDPELLNQPEFLEELEAARRTGALRYLIPYCTAMRFPKLASLAIERAEQLETKEQLRTMLNKILAANTDQEARYVLIAQDKLK